MILIRTIMNVHPGKQKELSQTLLSLIKSSGKEKGCLGYAVFNDIEDKNVFNVISKWESRQQLDQYISSNRFRVLLGTKSLLCEPLRTEILTVADSYPSPLEVGPS